LHLSQPSFSGNKVPALSPSQNLEVCNLYLVIPLVEQKFADLDKHGFRVRAVGRPDDNSLLRDQGNCEKDKGCSSLSSFEWKSDCQRDLSLSIHALNR